MNEMYCEKEHWANADGSNRHHADHAPCDLPSEPLKGGEGRSSAANLSGANLRGAELCHALFYGKGGTKELTKAQLPDFLAALGFVIKD